MSKLDPLASAVANLVKMAIEWQRVASTARCLACGSRVYRREADVRLSTAIDTVVALRATRKVEREDSVAEAPTLPKRRKPR